MSIKSNHCNRIMNIQGILCFKYKTIWIWISRRKRPNKFLPNPIFKHCNILTNEDNWHPVTSLALQALHLQSLTLLLFLKPPINLRKIHKKFSLKTNQHVPEWKRVSISMFSRGWPGTCSQRGCLGRSWRPSWWYQRWRRKYHYWNS